MDYNGLYKGILLFKLESGEYIPLASVLPSYGPFASMTAARNDLIDTFGSIANVPRGYTFCVIEDNKPVEYWLTRAGEWESREPKNTSSSSSTVVGVQFDVKDGYIVVTWDNGVTWHELVSLESLRGPRGYQGDKGDKGDTGNPGKNADLSKISISLETFGDNQILKYSIDGGVTWITVGTIIGGGGSIAGGGHWENAYIRMTDGTQPALPTNGEALPNSGWDNHVPVSMAAERGIVWMATRYIRGDGTMENWQGPWIISGEDGDAGVDGDRLEFIYTRTASEDSAVPSMNSTTPDSSSGGDTPADDDFVPQGWKDNASDPAIAIDETNRVMWMAFRVKSFSESNPQGTWAPFVGPFMWSVYGRSGTDGDGIEYIFCAGVTLNEDPTTWTNDEHFQDREYIRQGSSFQDDPIDLESAGYGPGTKQWVSIRRKYADNDGETPYWHAYSYPALWSYYAKDGDAGTGITIDLDNEMMATGIKSNGYNYAFGPQEAVASMYNGASPVNNATITDIQVKGTDNVDYTSRGYVTHVGNVISVEIPEDAVNFDGNQLLATITMEGTIPDQNNPGQDITVTRNTILSIIGISFGADGADGASYRLRIGSRVIHVDNAGTISPQSVIVSMVKTQGVEEIQVFTPNALPSTFKILYSINGSSSATILSNTAIPVNDKVMDENNPLNRLTISLYYNFVSTSNRGVLVDQETVFVIRDGEVDPSIIRFKSIVFKRSATQPDTPGNGVNPGASNYGGTFDDPIPYGWSDGIPAYDFEKSAEENTLWSTTRIFYLDGSVYSSWEEPTQMIDSQDYDVEFAFSDTYPATPATNNRHNDDYPGGYTGQVWFDPVDDEYTDTGKTVRRDFSTAVWRAEKWFKNDYWSDWTITRVKGENGRDGQDGKDGDKGADGRGIRETTTTYGVGTADTMPINWEDSLEGLDAYPGDWIWARTIIEYTDGTYSDPAYTKTRVSEDGSPSPIANFGGEYSPTKVYFGNSTRTDIVYFAHSGSTKGAYYITNPNAPESSFSGQPPMKQESGVWVLNSDYWKSFGESYDNIATGFAFIEDLTVVKLNTASVSGDLKRVQIMGNEMSVYDENNEQRLRITGDDIDLSNPVDSHAIQQVRWNNSVRAERTSGRQYISGNDSLTLCRFSVESNTEATIPQIVVEQTIDCMPEDYEADYIFRISNLKLCLYNTSTHEETELIQAFVPAGGELPATGRIYGETYTSNPKTQNFTQAGIWELRVKFSYYLEAGVGDSTLSGVTTQGWLDVWSNGQVIVTGSDQYKVSIGKNGMAINLGNNFSAAFGVENGSPVIRLLGLINGNQIGIRLTQANGLQKKGNSDSNWVNM